MEIRYNVTGTERKRLVNAIADTLEVKAKYLGAPSMAYEVDTYTVGRDGTLSFSDRNDSEEVERVIEAIAAAGFDCEPQDDAKENAEGMSERTENAPQGESVGLTVEIPLEKVAVGNLTKMLEVKSDLIKKALGVEDLRIEVLDDRVVFPWFPEVELDEAVAYTNFISKICLMTKNAKRVNVTEKEVDNEKYAFRCFLLRLGFIGAEYKTDRRILLKNLTGSSAFKNVGADNEVSE